MELITQIIERTSMYAATDGEVQALPPTAADELVRRDPPRNAAQLDVADLRSVRRRPVVTGLNEYHCAA